MGISKSTISRELRRNSTKRGKYNADIAQALAQERKERFAHKRRFTKEIEQRVRNLLEQEQWSPEQIVGWCTKNQLKIVSVERIYQYLRQDKAKGGTLYKHTRHKLKHRKRPVSIEGSRIKDRIGIIQFNLVSP